MLSSPCHRWSLPGAKTKLESCLHVYRRDILLFELKIE